MLEISRMGRLASRVAVIAAALAAVIGLLLVLSAVHLLPQLRNPFRTTTRSTAVSCRFAGSV